MAISIPKTAGRCLQKIAQDARWALNNDGAVGDSEAEELEDTLQFLDGHGQLDRLLPRLRDDMRARDSALAEARAGRFLASLGFLITAWEPPSPTGRPGDLLIRWSNISVFTEVKGPDWEGELSHDEKVGERKASGKFLNGEARPASPVQIPFDVIRRNILPKFDESRPNMAVLVDNLWISPASARGVVDGHVEDFFGQPGSGLLGGLLLLSVDRPAGMPVRNVSNFYSNSSALPSCQLPVGAVSALTRMAERDATQKRTESLAWKHDRITMLASVAKRL